MAPRRQRVVFPLAFSAACAAALWSCLRTPPGDVEAFAGSGGRGALRVAARRQAFGDFSAKSVEEMMKDPEGMKKMEAQAAELLKDPEKAKMMEQWSGQMQAGVEKLKQDPEMKQFFEDIEKGGLEAMAKYENNPEILAKFSQATGGPMGLAGMPGMAPGMGGPPAAPAAAISYQPGDQVFIRGLKNAPQLNGKKAMVVPPTPEEREKIEGTSRLIVRVIESGEQFAVKPENLNNEEQEVDAIMANNLEDVSIYNPAIQAKSKEMKDSGMLKKLEDDPELAHVFKDIKENGMEALQKYWSDEELMAKISKAMQG